MISDSVALLRLCVHRQYFVINYRECIQGRSRKPYFQLRDNVLFNKLCLYNKIWYMLHCITLDFSPVLTACINKVTYHRITL